MQREGRHSAANTLWRLVAPKAGVRHRAGRFVAVAREHDPLGRLIAARNQGGGELARRFGCSEQTATAIHSQHEHYNGGGHPTGLGADDIPILSRLLLVAAHAELALARSSVASGVNALIARRGLWYDPLLLDLALDALSDGDFVGSLRNPELAGAVAALEPASHRRQAGGAELDRVAELFGSIADAKSPHTEGHSVRVAQFACAMGEQLGLPPEQLRRLHRGGLLHDIGMLGVSSLTIEKAGALNVLEKTGMEQHPLYAWDILQHAGAFAEIAQEASLHHERLDGRGYPWGRNAEELEVGARVLAVADTFDAVTSARAFRPGLTSAEGFEILQSHRDLRLDGEAIDALSAARGHDSPVPKDL